MSADLDRERLTIALSGIPDDMAPDLDAKRNVWNVCSYVLVKMLDGLGDLAPNRFTYVFSYDDSESYEISVHRVRGESQLDALAKSNAALEQALAVVDRLTAELAEAEAAQVRLGALVSTFDHEAECRREPTGAMWSALLSLARAASEVERD